MEAICSRLRSHSATETKTGKWIPPLRKDKRWDYSQTPSDHAVPMSRLPPSESPPQVPVARIRHCFLPSPEDHPITYLTLSR
jgi:hypothetical protein